MKKNMLTTGIILCTIGALMIITSFKKEQQAEPKLETRAITMATYENCIVAFHDVFTDFLPKDNSCKGYYTNIVLHNGKAVIEENIDGVCIGRWPLPSPDKSLQSAREKMERLRSEFIQEMRYESAMAGRKALADSNNTEFHARIKRLKFE